MPGLLKNSTLYQSRLRPLRDRLRNRARHHLRALLPVIDPVEAGIAQQAQDICGQDQRGVGRIDQSECYVRHFRACEGKRLILEAKRGNLMLGGAFICQSNDGIGQQKAPGFSSYFSHWFKPQHIEGPVLVLRNNHENNYFHCLAHTLTKLPKAEAYLEDSSFPVVMSEAAYQQSFMRGAIELGYFGDHPIIVQKKNQDLCLGEAIVVNPPRSPYQDLDRMLDRFDIRGDAALNDRIFIDRGKASPNGRHVTNRSELLSLLSRYDFQIIDPQDHTLEQQMQIFSKARHVISAHGAGLTNIIFRRGAQLSVLEIFKPTLKNLCYQRVSEHYGFDYEKDMVADITGHPTYGDFSVNLDRLQDWLQRKCV